MTPEPPAVEFTINTESDRFDPEDDRWFAQTNELYAALRAEVSGVRTEVTPVPGTKGVVEAIILALGSAGAFSAAVDCFRAWLARDKSRRIVLTVRQGDHDERIMIEAGKVDVATLQRIAEAFGGAQ